MPALLVSHRRPGFYCRVITEGEVGAGDEIQKIADGPGKISVAETDSLLYTANHDLKRIAIAARIPALSPGWKSSFEGFLQADKNGIHNGNPGLTASISSPPAWNGFRWVKVVEVHRETTEVASIVFADTEGSPLPPALPGQYLAVRCLPDKNSPPVVRSYSISGASDSGTYRISVKRETGPGSQHLVDATQVGDKMEISAPRGEFILRAGAAAGRSIERRNWHHPGSFDASRSCVRKRKIPPRGVVDPCCAQCARSRCLPRKPGNSWPLFPEVMLGYCVQQTGSGRPARQRLRRSRALGPRESAETRRSHRSRLLRVWTIRLPDGYEPRSHLFGSAARCDTSRSVRTGRQHRARRNEGRS